MNVPNNHHTTNKHTTNNHTTKIGLAVGALVIALLVGLIAWLKPSDPAPVATATQALPNTASVASLPVQPTTASTPVSSNQLPPLPHSLKGTQVDGEIIIDENKQLVVTNGLRRLFDYFLSAQGEESLAVIRLRVIDYIQSHTPQPAAGQAIAIFEKYLSYLQEVAKLEKSVSPAQLDTVKQGKLDLNLIRQQQQAVKALRQRTFDDNTRRAFFGNEEALNDYNLQVVQTNQNANLSEAQKQTALKQAREAYIRSFSDPNTQQKIRDQDNIDALLAETEQLKAKGATEAELTAMRRKYVDEAAVQRLSQLDSQEAEFAKRVASFDSQRQQILQSQGNTPQAQAQINQLSQQSFTPTEQLRLDAMLKMDKN